MSGRTRKWQIPYPTNDDRIADTPAILKEMAERIDRILTQIANQ